MGGGGARKSFVGGEDPVIDDAETSVQQQDQDGSPLMALNQAMLSRVVQLEGKMEQIVNLLQESLKNKQS